MSKNKQSKLIEEKDDDKEEIRELDFPTLPLDKQVLKIVEIIDSFGGTATRKDIIDHSGIPSGTVSALLSSAKRYNLIKKLEGTNHLMLTELGASYVQEKNNPQGQKEVLVKAILSVPHFKKLIKEKQFSDRPSFSILRKIFGSYDIRNDYASRLSNVFLENLKIVNLSFTDVKNMALAQPTIPSIDIDMPILPEDKIPLGAAEAFSNGIKMGYVIGLTEISKDQDVTSLLEGINIDKVQNYVLLLKEQLKDGVIKEEDALKFLGKKFREFANSQSIEIEGHSKKIKYNTKELKELTEDGKPSKAQD